MELTDYVRFESVAIQVLRVRHPELRITAPTGDRGRDAYKRPLFGERDEIVGLFSCEKKWRAKLNRDLQPYGQFPIEEKPEKVFFVTNQPITEDSKEQTKRKIYDRYQIRLDIVALDELDLELKSDALHRVAERQLGVRPRQPRALQPLATFWDAQYISLPGRDAPLVGRDDELGRLRTALAPAADSPMNRMVIVEGTGGIGKTRLVVEAARAYTTLIARTGTALSEDKLVDVPVDVASVIVIDDAHRSPDLSGLAAMMGDPRFAGVTVVFAVRPGLAEPSLRRAGLDHVEPTTIALGVLGRSEINEIVAAHGITDEAFHLHVIDIAQGNPLIAHTACEIATQQGTYSWQDTAAVLRDLFKKRLSHITADEHEHRATAVALAVLMTAQNGEQLAALVGAVQGLPRDPHRLHEILIDLADAGIVDGPPYTLRPDVLGPVIVADALADGQRVNVDLVRTLQVLGRAASWGAAAGEESHDPGLLGISRSKPGADSAPAGVHATVLASQIGVLAQAAHQMDRHSDLSTLSRAVRELLSEQTDTTCWLDVLVLADAITPYRPPLLGELRDELFRRWPPLPGNNLWTDEPGAFGEHVLPDDCRTGAQLDLAIAEVRQILDKINPASPEAQPMLREIAMLPRELRAEGARGVIGTGSLPTYAVDALHSAAVALAEAVAERWATLPLGIRHTAADAAVRPAGRRPTTLAALAKDGDSVAVAAVKDAELGRMLVLFPISEDLHRIAQGGADAASLEHARQQKAEQLGKQLPFGEAIKLLESIDEPPSGLFGPACLEAFAAAVGRRAPAADAVLTRLAAGPLVGDCFLLAGLLQSEPGPVFAWVLNNITVPRIGVLGLAIARALSEERENTLLDAIATVLTTGGASPTSVELDTDGSDPLLPASTELAALADALARHLAGSHRRPVADRLERLAALSETDPAVALPRVLSAVGHVLRTSRAQHAVAVDHPDLRRRLATVLGRALAETDHALFSPVQGYTAVGGLELAVVAPAEVAELLIERTLADLPRVIPIEWHQLLADMDVTERAPVAEAFRVRLEQQRAAGTLTARTEETAHRLLTQLGGGTEQWVALVRDLATGGPVDRARAAQIVSFFWHHAVWAEIVPDLLDAGLDEHAINQLLEGLLIDNVDYNLDSATQARLDVLQPLLNDSRPAVREFADDATGRLSSLPSLFTRRGRPG